MDFTSRCNSVKLDRIERDWTKIELARLFCSRVKKTIVELEASDNEGQSVVRRL